jgi:hypothetical protein
MQASNIVYGLAKMNIPYSSCPTVLQQAIMATLGAPLQHMNAQEVSNMVYS